MDNAATAPESRTAQCPACGHELSSYAPPEASAGEQAAARVATIVAGWGFPLVVLAGVTTWAIINIVAKPIEPYPVVVLGWISAVLATIAACQGPLILLAQRRSAMNDRARDEEAFRVSLHAEADLHAVRESILELHDKIDGLSATR